MNRLPPLVRVAVRYGALASILGIGAILTFYYMGKHPFLVPVFFDFRVVLFAIFIFVAQKEFRDLSNEGLLFFWQGMSIAFVLVFTYAAIVSVFVAAFGHFVPDFVTTFIHQSEEQVKTFPKAVIEQIGKDTFERTLKELHSITEYFLARRYFVQCFVIGIFVSIILSVILRRQPKTN